MKSHLRPPFTLNMGHCSCPDLGFDPQRCLTPPFPQSYPPAIWTACMHMYTYVHTPTDTYACTCMLPQTYTRLHRHHDFRPLFSFSNIYHPLFGLHELFCVFLCVIFLNIIDLYVYVWIHTCTQIAFTTHKSLLFGIISNDEKASGEWYPLTLPFPYMWKCCSFYSFYLHNHALHVSRCLSPNKCCFTFFFVTIPIVATLHRHYIGLLFFSLIGIQPLGTQGFLGNSQSSATHSSHTLACLARPPSSAVNDSYVTGDLTCSPSVEM